MNARGPAFRRIPGPDLTVGVFAGPWDTGRLAQDGAVLGFADAEYAVRDALGTGAGCRILPLDIADFMTGALPRQLAAVDIVFANCGPLAAFLFHLREAGRLDFAIYREVRTLGWIGYAFQEYIANTLRRPGDRCLHISAYSLAAWQGVRADDGDRVFYPLLRQPRQPAARLNRGALRCGYFSRISSDKGFAFVPAIIGKLRDGGWPVNALVVGGAIEEPALFARCRDQLSRIGVAVDYRDELDHAASLDAMSEVDVVLFPSVSSFEACGRVVLEAYNLGRRVIASDYCVGADVLADDFLIPLAQLGPATGSSAIAFPVADLALERWQPPSPDAASFDADVCEQFRYEPGTVRRLMSMDAATPAVPALSLQLDWTGYDRLSAHGWCERLQSLLVEECRDRRDLLDLGGAFKRSLRRAGFEPQVRFRTTAARC